VHQLTELAVPQAPESMPQKAKPDQCEANCAKLHKRVFELALVHCPNCGDPGAVGDRDDPHARTSPKASARGHSLQAALGRPTMTFHAIGS